jgi:hypothetical protein
MRNAVGKPTDCDTARAVILAADLARNGAAASLIARLTGFSHRWARAMAREHQTASPLRLGDPIAWFEASPRHQYLTHMFLFMYELQPTDQPAGTRLLEARDCLCLIARHHPPLDINRCAQLVELYERGDVRTAVCTRCPVERFVLSYIPVCALCQMRDAFLCEGGKR